MSLTLLIETSTKACSVAVAQDNKVLASKITVEKNYSHAEQLNDFVAEVLNQADKSTQDLEAVAISKGPGSFTGLRIGTSAAKGFCYALDIPLVAVNTLAFMARAMADNNHYDFYCPMIDARRMEVYCGVFDDKGKSLQEVGAVILDEGSFSKWLNQGTVAFFGDGSGKLRQLLANNSNAIFVDEVYPDAANMASIAAEKLAANQVEDVAYFEPYYLKDFVAKPAKKLV